MSSFSRGRSLHATGFYVYDDPESFRVTIGVVGIIFFLLLIVSVVAFCCCKKGSTSGGHKIAPVPFASASKVITIFQRASLAFLSNADPHPLSVIMT